jgi:hypothetical protein
MKFKREVCTARKKRRLRNKHDARSESDLQFVSNENGAGFDCRDAELEPNANRGTEAIHA